MIRSLITTAHRSAREVGLCGQAPSDHPDFARLLVETGIDSISVTPDSFVGVKRHTAGAEAAAAAAAASNGETTTAIGRGPLDQKRPRAGPIAA